MCGICCRLRSTYLPCRHETSRPKTQTETRLSHCGAFEKNKMQPHTYRQPTGEHKTGFQVFQGNPVVQWLRTYSDQPRPLARPPSNEDRHSRVHLLELARVSSAEAHLLAYTPMPMLIISPRKHTGATALAPHTWNVGQAPGDGDS